MRSKESKQFARAGRSHGGDGEKLKLNAIQDTWLRYLYVWAITVKRVAIDFLKISFSFYFRIHDEKDFRIERKLSSQHT